MRGMDDEEEGKALEPEFHLLPGMERSRLYGDRRNHKEFVLFLHEWGHTAGLLHQQDRAAIMNPEYDRRQSGFSDFDRQVLALVVADRHLPRGGAEIEAMAANAELFRQRVALPPRAISAVPVEREPAYVADFVATSNVIQSAEPAKARASLETFAAAYPDSAGADLLACELEMRTSHGADGRAALRGGALEVPVRGAGARPSGDASRSHRASCRCRTASRNGDSAGSARCRGVAGAGPTVSSPKGEGPPRPTCAPTPGGLLGAAAGVTPHRSARFCRATIAGKRRFSGRGRVLGQRRCGQAWDWGRSETLTWSARMRIAWARRPCRPWRR